MSLTLDQALFFGVSLGLMVVVGFFIGYYSPLKPEGGITLNKAPAGLTVEEADRIYAEVEAALKSIPCGRDWTRVEVTWHVSPESDFVEFPSIPNAETATRIVKGIHRRFWNRVPLRNPVDPCNPTECPVSYVDELNYAGFPLYNDVPGTRVPKGAHGQPNLNWIDRAHLCARGIIHDCFPGIELSRRDPLGRKISHFRWMASELYQRKLDSETKACRWLGYLQAGLIFHGLSTLEREKARNLASAEGRVL